MTEKYFTLCEKCYHCLLKINENTPRLWMNLCSFSMHAGNPVIIDSTDFPELRELEKAGFILTTERNDSISVRVNGYLKTDDNQHFFCPKGGTHDDD